MGDNIDHTKPPTLTRYYGQGYMDDYIDPIGTAWVTTIILGDRQRSPGTTGRATWTITSIPVGPHT